MHMPLGADKLVGMGRPRAPLPVKLVVGLLSADPDLLRRARQLLTRAFGAVDAESELWPFVHTAYYRETMGEPLVRQFVSFAAGISPERIAEIKGLTNAIEATIADEALAIEHPRPVNLDPGYVDLSKLVLATTKDRSHRVYLSGGIYAEVTLQYSEGAWRSNPWTYPDYASPLYHTFFAHVREMLRVARALRVGEDLQMRDDVTLARGVDAEPIPLADEEPTPRSDRSAASEDRRA